MTRSKMFLVRQMIAFRGTSAPIRRVRPVAAPVLDRLEERVVLSHFSHHAHHFASRLAAAHVTTTTAVTATPATTTTTTTGTPAASTSSSTTVVATPATTTTTTTPTNPMDFGDGMRHGGFTQDTQLTTDLQKLQTDLKADVAGSTATNAQRFALGNDIRTLQQGGVTVDRTALKTVSNTLLTALADGTYDSSADTATAIKTSFAAAFTGTTVDATQVNQAFTDYLAVARGLKVTSAELTALTADGTVIQADFTRLGIGTNGTDPGPGSPSAGDLILGGFGGGEGPGGFGGGHGGFGGGPGGGRGFGGPGGFGGGHRGWR